MAVLHCSESPIFASLQPDHVAPAPQLPGDVMTRFETLSYEERARIVADAERMRSEAMAAMIAGVWRRLGATARRVFRAAPAASRA
jgi:hypothetical protein